MGHRCGRNCRRMQNPSTQKNCPSCGYAAVRRTLMADGRRHELSPHAIAKMRSENITKQQIKLVIENWRVRAVDVRIPNDLRLLY